MRGFLDLERVINYDNTSSEHRNEEILYPEVCCNTKNENQ
jgi:hypothetical protein